jgi:L-amino acid N-acyltransferase YncA
MAANPATPPAPRRLSPVVRPFTEGDVGAANALTNLYIRETAVHFGYAEGSDTEFCAMWEKAGARYPWLAAEVEGRFAGFAKSGVWRERDAYRFTVETTVYVSPEFQRRGVGLALMMELLSRLTEAGFHMAIAGVTLPNEGSVGLHEALGFQRVGVYPEVGRKFERWWDVGFWAKRLTI